jgi:hypothetical protein
MKTNVSKSISAAIAGMIILGTSVPSHSGIFKILKGESAKACECESYQRVAFVGEAMVREVKGHVQVLAGVGEWTSLSAGQKLNPGDMVKTAPGGIAVLKMNDSGSFVRVTSQTILRLVPFEQKDQPVSLSSTGENGGFVVRALRGRGEYQTVDGWKPITHESQIAPGSKVRLNSDGPIDFFSRAAGTVRLTGKGEAQLPRERLQGSRELRGTPPTLAFSTAR